MNISNFDPVQHLQSLTSSLSDDDDGSDSGTNFGNLRGAQGEQCKQVVSHSTDSISAMNRKRVQGYSSGEVRKRRRSRTKKRGKKRTVRTQNNAVGLPPLPSADKKLFRQQLAAQHHHGKKRQCRSTSFNNDGSATPMHDDDGEKDAREMETVVLDESDYSYTGSSPPPPIFDADASVGCANNYWHIGSPSSSSELHLSLSCESIHCAAPQRCESIHCTAPQRNARRHRRASNRRATQSTSPRTTRHHHHCREKPSPAKRHRSLTDLDQAGSSPNLFEQHESSSSSPPPALLKGGGGSPSTCTNSLSDAIAATHNASARFSQYEKPPTKKTITPGHLSSSDPLASVALEQFKLRTQQHQQKIAKPNLSSVQSAVSEPAPAAVKKSSPSVDKDIDICEKLQSDAVLKLNVPTLKHFLRKASLRVGGRKAELIQRLRAHHFPNAKQTDQQKESPTSPKQPKKKNTPPPNQRSATHLPVPTIRQQATSSAAVPYHQPYAHHHPFQQQQPHYLGYPTSYSTYYQQQQQNPKPNQIIMNMHYLRSAQPPSQTQIYQHPYYQQTSWSYYSTQQQQQQHPFSTTTTVKGSNGWAGLTTQK